MAMGIAINFNLLGIANQMKIDFVTQKSTYFNAGIMPIFFSNFILDALNAYENKSIRRYAEEIAITKYDNILTAATKIRYTTA